MAVYFHPLPAEVFPADAQPSIKRLNHELRDLFGLEGTLRSATPPTQRSDVTVVRNRQTQVDVTRVSGLQSSSAVAALTQAQIDILNGVANHVFASGFGPVMTVSKAGVLTKVRLDPVWDAGVASWRINVTDLGPA